MIKYVKQDLSAITRGVVAHGVNCKGVMGSGVAAALRSAHPIIFVRYKQLCDMYEKTPEWLIGTVDFVDVRPDTELIIANCFTQESFGRSGGPYADAEAIKLSVQKAMLLAKELGLPFYMPKIGCGLGGLSWEKEIECIISDLSSEIGIDVNLCDL